MGQIRKIFQVDAFTREPFKGNPAGVCLCDKFPSESWMLGFALEMNLSETAFVVRQNDEYTIRYFTPTMEVPLCGHATLASAHVLHELGQIHRSEPVTIVAPAGRLIVTALNEWICMDFPTYPITRMDVPPEFVKLFGFVPIEIYTSLYGWVMAVASSRVQIESSEPQFEALKNTSLGHVMITAQNDTKDADFVVRCFAPSSGINEDPVTGSAHCALTPYWASRLGKTEMNSLQVSKRTGNLRVKMVGDRVHIYGQACTVFSGNVLIP